ncbi:hypothetical protein A6V36_32500 [Paraburkholderia ginsengiterrae]|uniref:Uncharacterized protein n=1 Tax=Paraburkholderia ginsengiterrae TaxID=1462993 RepID=A0A1A9N5G7_9BURK|nr:tetratricopeptide repeat protein [Paraburkholderia ginsengiterrae]OAJ56912.1 hypothetical protein A6V37_30480 [Paraburkholderia ginsengiterrae]OAJ56968.1 hypothetical protein A6V36_32500 [Paraburkholderia ginsengiterrae]
MAIENEADLDALVKRADAHFAARRMIDAAACYRQVIAFQPRDAYALHRMGLVSVHLDDLDRARDYIEQALQLAPARAELWEHAGILAALKGNHESALAFYYRAIRLSGSTASLHRNLGDCLRLAGRPTEALYHYDQAIRIEPTLYHAVRSAACLSKELAEVQKAAGYWLHAWALGWSSLQDGLAVVSALAEAGRDKELRQILRQIRERLTRDAEGLQSLATVLNRNDRYADALIVAKEGLAIAPEHGSLHYNAAHALCMLGRVSESLTHCEEAARLLPESPPVQFRLATVQLALGNFEQGWKQYKWLYEMPDVNPPHPDFPEWQGEQVAGSHFLLVGEQGRGDEIQCVRFAAWLHNGGAIVDLLVSEPVAALLARVPGVRSVFVTVPRGPYDYWCHMLRMPERMELDLNMLPIATNYLVALPEKVCRWQSRIDAMMVDGLRQTSRRIGLVWAGSSIHPNDRNRSIQLDAFRSMFALPGFTWFSLQKGEDEQASEAMEAEFDLYTLGPAIEDFDDTLAILQSLDLLISVDTSVAHLAGAAGKPVWTLISVCNDWRWMKKRSDSPWYPSMRLFRQRELGEWAPVIAEVRNALIEWCGETTA